MVGYKYADLYSQDNKDKQLIIKFDTGIITNTDLHSENFELSESICSGEVLRFGSCEASGIKFRISNITNALKDKWLAVTETLDGNTDVSFPFGEYKVFSDKPTADRRYRDITAYDAMYDILHAEVSGWYNTILPAADSTVTLKAFRDSFLAHFGIEQEEVTLANDSMTVTKTIEPTSLSGKTVITAICEINGCFGHIGRDGKFKYVFLQDDGLYPSDTLYPAEDLYPVDNDIPANCYIRAEYEDYTTALINKLQIRQEEDDIGATYPPGDITESDNCYIVQDNFLVYGKSSDELNVIAENLYSIISTVTYQPVHVEAKGNPCREVGDAIELRTKNGIITSYILQRTLKGIHALRDTYDAEGEQYQQEKVNGIREQIIQLKGKANKLTRTIEETRLEITDLEKGLNSRITQNAGAITAEVTRAKAEEGRLSSLITQTAEQVKIEVSKTYATQSSVQSTVANLQQQIDGAIETFTGSAVPTLSNAPAKDWTTDAVKDTHIGDLYVVNSSGGNYAGFYYRFEKNGTTYQWVLLKDNEVTKALQDAADAMARANAVGQDLQTNYSTTTQMNSAITAKADEITLEVSEKYSTKIEVTEAKESAVNTAAQDATSKANAALTSANNNTSNLLKSYSTTTEMNSIISAAVDEIRLEVTERTSVYNEEINTLHGGMEDSLDLSFFYTEDGAIITTQTDKNCIYAGTGENTIQNSCTLYQDVILPSGTYLFSYEWLRTISLYTDTYVKLYDKATGKELYSKYLGYATSSLGIWTKETIQFGLEKTTSIRFSFEFEAPYADVTRINSTYLTNIALYGTAQGVADAITDMKTELLLQQDQIQLRVEKNGVVSAINASSEAVTISASKIDLVGLVSATEFTSKYATITDLEAVNLRVKNIETDYISAETVNANFATFNELNVVSQRVSNVEANYITANAVAASYATINALNSTNARIDSLDTNIANIEDTLTYDGYQADWYSFYYVINCSPTYETITVDGKTIRVCTDVGALQGSTKVLGLDMSQSEFSA